MERINEACYAARRIVDHHRDKAGPNLRILLAEDDEIIQKVTLLMLKKLGYCADVAANGFEVLSALEHCSYDIVLMDIQMPEMDGLEATRIIRQNRQEGLRIIAVTASAPEETREKCFDVGMNDYVSKPVKLNELANLLSRAPGLSCMS